MVKLVVVKEDGGDNVHIEELGGDGTGEVVEPDIQEGEIGGVKDLVREGAGEFVVAEIELVEVSEIGDEFGDDAGEVVGVCMEESNVGQTVDEAIENQVRTTESEVVKANSGQGGGFVIGDFVADESFVFTNVFSYP